MNQNSFATSPRRSVPFSRALWGALLVTVVGCDSDAGTSSAQTGGASGASTAGTGNDAGAGTVGGSAGTGARGGDAGAVQGGSSGSTSTGGMGAGASASGRGGTAGESSGGSAGMTATSPPGAPTDLTVGDRARPMNVEGPPLFGWLVHDGPNEIQTAYRLTVQKKSDGATVWDSGKVVSSDQAYVVYAGPPLTNQTSYTWIVRTWDRDDQVSPPATPAEFDTGLADADWAASWIRRTSAEVDDYSLARKELAVAASPVVRARVYVAASHQYELRLNGTTVDRGASLTYPGEGYYQATDVTERVAPGQPLAIGVIYHWYGSGQGRPASERGLLLRLVVDHADGTQQVVVTDNTWRVKRATEWRTGGPQRNVDSGDYVERIDATLATAGWDRAGYDASGSAWAAPQVIGRHPSGVFTHLVGQEGRVISSTVSAVTVRTLADGSVVADFGKVQSARPLVHFASGASGRALSMLAGYQLLGDGHVSTVPEATQGSDLSFLYVQTAGAQDFRPLTHFAWRYLQISAPGETLSTTTVQALVEHTDVPPSRTATFQSSNTTLNSVFELVQHSALHSAAYQFVDTPTREKGQFLADAANLSSATMSGFLERDLTQQALIEFANSQARHWAAEGRVNAVYPNGDGKRDIPDFTETYAAWIDRYYLMTGDRTLLAKVYPVLVKVADYVWSYRNAGTGLVTNLAGGSLDYEFGIIDWPLVGRYGYDMTTSARSTINMLAVAVMQSASNAATALGRDNDVRTYAQRATDLTTAINARLRRTDGIYIDGLLSTGTQSPHASQHANSYAIALGIAPVADRGAIAAYVAGLGMRQGPMTAHWLLKALGDADMPDAVVARLTDASGPGWANILARGGTFTWETWDPTASESQSHGWGSHAIVDFVETLLGVRVTAPGAATLSIVIPRTTLASAHGTVPTQRGPVSVDWQRATDGTVSVVVNVPVNVRALVSLPVADGATPSASGDGAPVSMGAQAGRAQYETGSGRSEFSVR